MKKVLTKVGYMAFGSLLTLIGYHFGNIDNNTANAQRIFDSGSGPVVRVPKDEIRCRRLVIVGADNTPRITLGLDSFDRGAIEIGDEHRNRRVYLNVATFDGVEGGTIELSAKDSGSVSAILGTDLYGGYMTLYNRNPASIRPVVHASITSNERGAIVLRDTIGQQTDSMYGQVPREIFQTRDTQRTRNFHGYLRD